MTKYNIKISDMMNTLQPVLFIAISLMLLSCKNDNYREIASPSGEIILSFELTNNIPQYSIRFNDEVIIKNSMLGFMLESEYAELNQFDVLATSESEFDDTWELPWGEQLFVRNHYKELMVEMEEMKEPYRKLNLFFRVFNDGVGFRYWFPEQIGIEELLINNEITRFNLTDDHYVWWIPGDWDIYEHLYTKSKFSDINALESTGGQWLAQSYIPVNAVNTPVTMKTSTGTHMCFHEAALTNYPGMTLQVDPENLSMQSNLVGSENTSYRAKVKLPFKTPWRVIIIEDQAKDLVASNLILNLNESNKIGNVEYVKPTKYNGIWWEMHLNKSTWDMASGKHGATTKNAKRYIDFAAQNNLGGVLIEGWNTGWEKWIGIEDREGIFDFVTPYPDYNLHEVVSYARQKGVDIIMHHETSAAINTYEKQLDTAFTLMKELGIHSVKTGYVGKIIPKGEYHHGQFMVNHYRNVLETAAKYQIAINAHEPIKATGIRRTYPNAISREGLRGQEFNAWATDGGNPPSHLPTIAFTRMLAGPIDFTPGVFNIKLDPYRENNQVNTTIAHQLALYVVIYSPIQMACDLPEHYENHLAFQFIRDVGVDWDTTVVINGEVGEYVTVARKERNTGNWFMGSITNEQQRDLTITLDFLDVETNYSVTIYSDGDNAHWDKNPEAIDIMPIDVNRKETIELQLAPGGGAAISFLKTN
jgi:hypothetical protein